MEEIIQGLIAVLLTGVVVALRSFIAGRLTPQRLDALAGAARTVVLAADQAGVDNDDKFKMAVNALNALGKRLGFRKLRPEEVHTFVEAAVAELKTLKQPQPTLTPEELDALLKGPEGDIK